MVVVLGHLVVVAEDRAEHLRRSAGSVRAARAAPGCLHFAVTADALEPTWVTVAELWSTRAELDAFRSGGSTDDEPDPFAHVQEFHVQEYEVPGA